MLYGSTQGKHREHTGKTQGTHREYTGKTQGKHREHTGKTHGAHREYAMNIGLHYVNLIGSNVQVSGQKSSLKVKGQGYMSLETPTLRH